MRSAFDLATKLLRAGYDPNSVLVRLALRKALVGCESVLDVGCGVSPDLRHIGVKHSVGAEGYAPAVEKARQENTHDQMVQCDVSELSRQFQPGQFDACIAMDVIEHLPKEKGFALIADMEKIAKKRVVFFTPNGFLEQKHADQDDLQEHLSGWEPDEFRQKGYAVTGWLGPKVLRGPYHRLKHRPAAFWGLASLAADVFVGSPAAATRRGHPCGEENFRLTR